MTISKEEREWVESQKKSVDVIFQKKTKRRASYRKAN